MDAPPHTNSGIALPEIVLGNSNRRFSGITSTLLQVLPRQLSLMKIVVLGAHHLPQSAPYVGFFQLVKALRSRDAVDKTVVFHARRNNEMIQALVLKRLVRCQLKILFTSTAQRYHTGFTLWLMHQMDSVISTCSAAAAYLPMQPDLLIPHGVDAERYRPPPIIDDSADYETLSHRKHIGIFGRVRAQKGVDTLIAAALPLLKVHPDWDIVVVGEVTPDQRDFVSKLKAQAAASGVLAQVTFIGKQSFDSLPALFRAMTIVTALSRNEGFGLTVLEAMSSGRPVIASRAGAWPDVIDSGVDGLLVEPGVAAETRDALARLIENEPLREQLSQAARQKIVDHYTVEREAERLISHYQTLASTRMYNPST